MARQSRPPRLILTRPRAQAERFAASLTLDIEVVIAPLIDIVWRDLGAIDPVSSFILTSENGALALRGQPVSGRVAYCVGARTKAVAASLGLEAVDMGGTADHLVAGLLADRPKGPLIHLRGAHARGDIAERLRADGLICEDRVVYDQHAQAFPTELAAGLGQGAPDFVALFSPRTAQLFARACAAAPQAEMLCLSHAVAEMLDPHAYGRVEVAANPTAQALAEALYRRAAAKRLEGPEASS